MNYKFYKRNDVSISFVAKTEFKDDAEEFVKWWNEKMHHPTSED